MTTDNTKYHQFFYQAIDTSNEIAFFYKPGTPNRISFYQKYSNSYEVRINSSFTPTNNQWYHVAISRSGNNWYFFVDGTSLTVNLEQGSLSAALRNYNAVLKIGSINEFYYAWMQDETRISKGVAIWTSSFTPSTYPYMSSNWFLLQQRNNVYNNMNLRH